LLKLRRDFFVVFLGQLYEVPYGEVVERVVAVRYGLDDKAFEPPSLVSAEALAVSKKL
jgi:hypothetical protein